MLSRSGGFEHVYVQTYRNIHRQTPMEADVFTRAKFTSREK